MDKSKWFKVYKGFNIIKNGTRDYPWNIYKDDGRGFGEHVGYDRTLKSCKDQIDDGVFDELKEGFNDFDKRWLQKFGDPRTRVMTVDGFDEMWQEMMDFE